MTPSHEIHIQVKHIIKLYTNDIGWFPVRSRSGNQYILIAYHFYSNDIISSPFKSCSDKQRLLSYGAIMQLLKDRTIPVDLQILDKEASAEYNLIFKAEWVVGYQLVPPHIHSRNSAERAICTFKAHFYPY